MTAVKKILFPVDLSEASPKIVPWVKTMAEKFGAEVHVLFVARVFDQYSGMGVPYSYISDLESSIISRADAGLREFVQNNLADIPTKAQVVSGYPAEEILEYSEKEGVDIIIIGTHGRKGIERILFGSVAEHVVKNSPVPVFTINPYKGDAE